MKYQILGIIVSVALLLAGIFYDITTCIMVGIVFMLCNIGAVVGIKLRDKKKKLLPIVLVVAVLVTIISFYYVFK